MLFELLWNLIVQGEISSEIRSFVRGSISEVGGKLALTQSQLRGVFYSIVSVSVIGALFTISPALLSMIAAIVGFIWPTWVSEMMNRTRDFFDETIAQGRGKISKIKTMEPKRYDKNRYHYYHTSDGKKRFYRVGEPWIISQF